MPLGDVLLIIYTLRGGMLFLSISSGISLSGNYESFHASGDVTICDIDDPTAHERVYVR